MHKQGMGPFVGREGGLSQELKSTEFSNNPNLFSINQFFDRAELCGERSDKLLAKSKPAVVKLFLFLHLLIDLVVVLAVLLWKFG